MPCVATNISGLSEIYLLLVISTMKKTHPAFSRQNAKGSKTAGNNARGSRWYHPLIQPERVGSDVTWSLHI